MQTFRGVFLLTLLALLVGCNDYPPVEQTETFNINRSVSFVLANTASLNKDTQLTATAKIDTAAYFDSLSAGYLLKTATVGRLYLTSSDPNFTLDELGAIHILIGADTVAIDTLPQGTQDTSFMLTNADITPLMRNASFTATLKCNLQGVPKDTVTLNCGMTVIYTANVRP